MEYDRETLTDSYFNIYSGNMLFRVDLGKSGNHLVPEIPETKYLRVY